MARRLSLSKVHLATICSWWLRDDVERPPLRQSQAAKNGYGLHALIESFLNGTEKPKKPLADSVRFFNVWMQSEHPARLMLSDIRTELAMRIDFRTGEGRVDAGVKERGYPKETDPYVMWGTADVVRYDGDSAVEVDDWKTGQSFPSAVGNGQLLSLATALYGVKPFKSIETRIVHIGDAVSESVAVVTEADVAAWRQRVATMVANIDSSQPVAGNHCSKMFCEQFGRCPATKHLLVNKDVAA